MDASPELLASLPDYWNKLSPGTQDNIIGGLVVAVVVGVLALFRKGIGAGLKRAFNQTPAPTTQHEVLIKVEQQPPSLPPQPTLPQPVPEPPAQVSSHSPDIPRLPAISFVPRRDKQGRDLLEQLKEKLAPGNKRLVALWGPGGVGKTRLATEAAHARSGDFAGRVVWVSADGRPDFTLSTLLDAIATQFDRKDLRQLAPDPKHEGVRELVCEAPTLLVLDNFETIAPEEQARCRDFLARATTCPALITTRGFIESNLVDNVSIDAMLPDEAQRFLEQLITQAPDPACFDMPTRERIIRTAASIPLVIEWIVRQIFLIQESQDVLERLAHGDSDAARRVFDSSFNLPQVGDDGRATLLALSLFTPDASRPALAEVAGFGSDFDRLSRALAPLGSLRLLRTAEGGRRVLIEGLTRDLAQSHLSKDSRADEFRRRFITHFLTHAEEHAEPTPENLDALEVEKDNLLGVIDLAFGLSDWMSVMGLTNVLCRTPDGFLQIRGYWDEVIKHSEQAVIAAQLEKHERAVLVFAGNEATVRFRRGELDRARQIYQSNLKASRKLGSDLDVAVALQNLGVIATEENKLDIAQQFYTQSLDIYSQVGSQRGIADITSNLAQIAEAQGELADAVQLFDASLKIFRELGIKHRVAQTLYNLAITTEALGNLSEARQLYDESLALSSKLGDQEIIARNCQRLGELLAKEGEKADAAVLFQKAFTIFNKLGSPLAETSLESLKSVEGKSS